MPSEASEIIFVFWRLPSLTCANPLITLAIHRVQD